MKHISILRLALAAVIAACHGSKPSYEQVIHDFKEESGADFMDCGAEPASCPAEGVHPSDDFATTADCLVAAWMECRPASATFVWYWQLTEEVVARSVFVVPDGQDCRLVVFESTGTDDLDRLECADLLTTGECGVLEPAECEWQSLTVLAPQRG